MDLCILSGTALDRLRRPWRSLPLPPTAPACRGRQTRRPPKTSRGCQYISLCVYIYICVYIYMYICTHTIVHFLMYVFDVYIYIHTCINMFYVYYIEHVCKEHSRHVHTCIYTSEKEINERIHMYMYMRICIYIYMHILTCIYTNDVCVYMYIIYAGTCLYLYRNNDMII